MKAIQSELRKWCLDLKTAGHPDSAVQLYRSALAWVKTALESARRKKSRVAETYREKRSEWLTQISSDNLDPHPLYYHTLAASVLFVGAWFVFGLEAFLGAVLTQMKTQLSPIAGAVVGIGVAIALTFAAKVVLAPKLGDYENEGKKAARVMGITIAVLGLAVAVFVTLAILAIRSEVDSPVWDYVFWMSTGLLSLLLPSLAAVAFLGSALFGWSKKLTKEFDAAENLERRLEAFKGFVEQALSRLQPTFSVPAAPVAFKRPESKEGA